MMTTREKMPYEEQERLGEAIYDTRIRRRIAQEDEDKYVLVDVLTGDYEIHENPAIAGRKLRARRPDAIIHAMRRHVTYVGRMPSMRLTGRESEASK